MRAEYVEREGVVEKIQSLTRELRAAHVGVAERAVSDVMSAWAAAAAKCAPAGKVSAAGYMALAGGGATAHVLRIIIYRRFRTFMCVSCKSYFNYVTNLTSF